MFNLKVEDAYPISMYFIPTFKVGPTGGVSLLLFNLNNGIKITAMSGIVVRARKEVIP